MKTIYCMKIVSCIRRNIINGKDRILDMLNEIIEKEKGFTIFKNIISLYSNNDGIKANINITIL